MHDFSEKRELHVLKRISFVVMLKYTMEDPGQKQADPLRNLLKQSSKK